MVLSVSLLRSRLVRAFLVCAAFGAIVAPATAAEKKAPNPERIFARKDANGDKSLSLEEFKTGLKDKALANADKRFAKLDTSGDGKVSLDEFKAGITPKK